MGKTARQSSSKGLTLALLRHAKSSWAVAGQRDYDRPLNDRGRRAAPGMGTEISRLGIRPQLVLCSSAARARQTLDLVLPELERTPEVSYEDGLYLASPQLLMARLQKIGADIRSVLMVGHNPGLHALALDLVGAGAEEDLASLARKLPTAGLVVVAFDSKSWPELLEGSGRLLAIRTPKSLDDD